MQAQKIKIIFRKLRSQLVLRLYSLINEPRLDVNELIIGKNVQIDPGVHIQCQRLVLGDNVRICSGTRVEMTDLVIGDYTTINHNCFLSGDDWCRIGHNCWIGHYSLINSTGTLRIGNGVGIGAHSQLWTHIYFGDILQGCRFAAKTPMRIEDDVWFVGHCIVSPINAGSQSMALVGSVVTRDMEPNHVYGGVPAQDITNRFGFQFAEVPLAEKKAKLEIYFQEFLSIYQPKNNRIRIVDIIDNQDNYHSQFSCAERSYTKRMYKEEIAFMNYLNPTKAKFFPTMDTDWVKSYLESAGY